MVGAYKEKKILLAVSNELRSQRLGLAALHLSTKRRIFSLQGVLARGDRGVCQSPGRVQLNTFTVQDKIGDWSG